MKEGGYQMDNKMDLVLFNSYDGQIYLSVAVENETVWLTLGQLAELFGRDKSTISRHIRNVYSEGELERTATVANFATVQEEGKQQAHRTHSPRLLKGKRKTKEPTGDLF